MYRFNVLSDTDDEESGLPNIRRYRRVKYYAPRINFTFQYEADFYEAFRMTPATAEDVLRIIGPDIQLSNRGGALKPHQQLCTTLHWLGQGSQYHATGLSHGIHKTTVGRTIHRVVSAINRRLFQRKVCWPSNISGVVEQFYRKANFPSVIGVIDGSLIPIDAPTTNEEAFVDRKGSHSINCMVVCGPNLEFFYVSANWPGSVHDARVLRRSSLFRRMEEENIFPNGVILGDSAYPLKVWLMRPLNNDPTSEGERRYNSRLKSTRQTVERGLGVIKEKFPCLNHLRVNPYFACQIVKCCATLCNISRENEENDLDFDNLPLQNEDENNYYELNDDHIEVDTRRRQLQIIQSML